ncbi:MAG: hypothetical protein AAGA54_05935 [Myxococcota bacterium]
METAANDAPRLREEPWVLVKQTMGSPREFREKVRKLRTALLEYGRDENVVPRLRRLRRLGYIDEIPNRTQRMVGAIDMLRFFIVPAAADYYEGKGINFRFHTLLRFLDDPASLIDPTGFNSTRDAIIGHVMQVVHANPHYDFQLLESFEGGLEALEQQIHAVLDGSHPRAASIRSIVEDTNYHADLLDHLAEYRRNPEVSPLRRENIEGKFEDVERTFGTVPSAMRYFSRMPRTVRTGIRHLVRVRAFPTDLAA